MKRSVRRVRYFFPIQLLILHIKKNHFLLFFWMLLFGFTTQLFASKFGVPQQFLIPEYRGGTGVISFGIVGFALGGFITAFNLYTYIMHGYRFPFIATLSRPFHKFSLNNFFIPLLFIVTYAIYSGHFQLEKEFIPLPKVLLNLCSFLLGVMVFQGLSYFYFYYTNKEVEAYENKSAKRFVHYSPIESPIHNSLKWAARSKKATKWRVDTYMYSFKSIHLARDSRHYDGKILDRVFSQNHINAARFEIALVVTFIVIGSLRENEYFVIPAAASGLLFFTMLLMLISALYSWIKGWTLSIFIGLMVVLNVFFADIKLFRIENHAYGLNYDVEPAIYNPYFINPDSITIANDKTATLQILEEWKNKQAPFLKPGELPKLVIINCSGGGSRSAFWSMRALMEANDFNHGRLLESTAMMTGASGGMVGAAYLREMMLRQVRGEKVDVSDTAYAEHIAKDLLNPIIFSIAFNDWFIRYQKADYGGHRYTKDRAWAFEQQLNRNTNGWLDKTLNEYVEPEKKAQIPMMILTPTIVNDGRRLIIASQPMSYLATTPDLYSANNSIPENIEFLRLFHQQGAPQLRFTSALRMNATFPYVAPMATLPSDPPMEILDAGIRDNYGIKTSEEFLFVFRDWINANTSGVIIVQVRDLPKGKTFKDSNRGIFGKLTAPVGSIYGNITKTHDYNNEQMMEYLQASFDLPIHWVTFELQQDLNSHISLSWHLTQQERNQIRNAIKNPVYRNELERLYQLLNE